ncbi:hypothetical protein DEU56DRAFT_791703, partial [Suillus clintonianus]|uniref:uncharacterized protein n=1 Tax=Suillus clintonianus TaxID=1904413 RepID=UPI001B86B769
MSPQTTHPALLTRNIILLGKPCLGKAGFALYHNPFYATLLAFYCLFGMIQYTLCPALAARAVLSIHRSSCTILYFTTSFILSSASLGMCGGSYVNSRLSTTSVWYDMIPSYAMDSLLIFDIRALQLLFVLNSCFSQDCGSIYHYFLLAS